MIAAEQLEAAGDRGVQLCLGVSLGVVLLSVFKEIMGCTGTPAISPLTSPGKV